ncbi:MAG: hypothetical protein WC011_00930 [Candidatus Paceibacterota bacterium]
MKPFRNNHPTRKYTGTPKNNYKDYREILRQDYDGRCGFTDCKDVWWAGGFQIDHFAPQNPKILDAIKLSKFSAKEHVYENLIYASPQVNRIKSNDWPSDDPDVSIVGKEGYFHPCDVDFNDYFERTDCGGIVPKDHPIARYMWKKLKLYLKRYELYWRIEKIAEQQKKLITLKNTLNLPETIKAEVNEGIAELAEEYQKYFSYLEVNYLEIV